VQLYTDSVHAGLTGRYGHFEINPASVAAVSRYDTVLVEPSIKIISAIIVKQIIVSVCGGVSQSRKNSVNLSESYFSSITSNNVGSK
jgi:hypothetical protein